MCLSAAAIHAQKSPATVKNIPSRVPFEAKTVKEISNVDWNNLAAALDGEDWNKSVILAAQYLQNLKTDNDKKQLAQLRYLYIYALAGKILAATSQNNALEAQKNWAELDLVIETFIGKEFVLPPRQFVENCSKALNVICQVKSNSNALRTTATNREGNAIHSFDYVVFDQAVNISEFNAKPTFLGGILRKAEYNEDKSKPWVMRLFFNKGFVRIILPKS